MIRCPYKEPDESNEWSLSILSGANKDLQRLLSLDTPVFIHGTLFHVPSSFYRLHDIPEEEIFFSFIKPDFLILHLLPGGKDEKKILQIQVVDAKA
ncbi:MAG: hypothetical protein NXI00_22680, partial [Cytophagales bacterium]|nr:hypothetical protein [Cytophagales bacterium]